MVGAFPLMLVPCAKMLGAMAQAKGGARFRREEYGICRCGLLVGDDSKVWRFHFDLVDRGMMLEGPTFQTMTREGYPRMFKRLV